MGRDRNVTCTLMYCPAHCQSHCGMFTIVLCRTENEAIKYPFIVSKVVLKLHALMNEICLSINVQEEMISILFFCMKSKLVTRAFLYNVKFYILSKLKQYFYNGQNTLSSLSGTLCLDRRKKIFHLTMHSVHFIYGYMASDILCLRSTHITRENPLLSFHGLLPFSSKGSLVASSTIQHRE